MKFILFGTGDYYERYKKWFESEEVVAIIDNSPQKQNNLMDGIQVLAPDVGVKFSFDAIVILSFYVKEMRAQLVGLGVPREKIYHFYDLHRLLYRKSMKKAVQFFGAKKEELLADKQKKILLLSQDMTLGGPAIALYHVAETLVKNGCQIVFATMIDGPLRQKLLDEGIPVILDVNLQIETMRDAEWTNGFSVIFCNAINFCVFLSDRNTDIPFIWWLHDSAFFYDGIDREILKKLDQRNLFVYSVGKIPEGVIQSLIPNIKVKDLLYGVADMYQSKKVCFVTIGYIEQRKGQDILIRAIRRLPENIRQKCEFYIIGQNTSAFARQIATEVLELPEVEITGTMDRNQINNILEKADVLICPSREDPMPTVAAEAMMHSVPCIVSSVTGTSEYIVDGENGFVFESENTDELSAKIKWCVENCSELRHMGISARKVYDDNFSLKVFEKNIMNMLAECQDI